LAELLRFGQEAVILFFLLSGFVIHYSSTHAKHLRFTDYFLKRFTRIYAPLLVVFFIGFLSESYNHGTWLVPSFKQVIYNLFMLQDWAFAKPNVIVEPLFNNTPLWSLSYEWWFYMLYFPLIKFLPSRVICTRAVFIASFVAALTYVVYPFFLNRLIMYLAIWWAGVALADVYIGKKPITFTTLAPCIITLVFISAVLLANVIILRLNGDTILLGAHPLLELHVMTSAQYLNFINQPIVEWICYFLILLVVSWALEVKFYRLVSRKIRALRKPLR